VEESSLYYFTREFNLNRDEMLHQVSDACTTIGIAKSCRDVSKLAGKPACIVFDRTLYHWLSLGKKTKNGLLILVDGLPYNI